MHKKVIVGLSGGVDSSVAAFLLKQQNYLVEGCFMKNWDSGLNLDLLGNPFLKDTQCPQEKDYQDALQVAQKLNIKCHKVNFVNEYFQQVFKKFLKDLKNNLTPNPDVLCNNKIKFKLFIEYVKKFKPDFIATGHYAKLEYDNKKNPILKKSLDLNKDQSYFLSQLKSSQLKNILFPLGNLTKIEVRQIAQKIGLINANKKDSTGICFIGERKFADFLKNYLPNKTGPMKKIDNTYLKEHKGTVYYTIGQRKGLELGSLKNNPLPWFVVGKDLKNNILFVEQGKNNIYLYSDSALITNVVFRFNIHFIKDKLIKNQYSLKAKFRYRQLDQLINIKWIQNNKIKIDYPHKIKAITPGQICAFYLDNICVGAGIIKEVYFQNQKRLYT